MALNYGPRYRVERDWNKARWATMDLFFKGCPGRGGKQSKLGTRDVHDILWPCCHGSVANYA